MTGLADMHVHFVREALPENPQKASADASVRRPGIPASASKEHELENRAYALMFLVNGVTTVRNMWGSETIDALAKRSTADAYSDLTCTPQNCLNLSSSVACSAS
jgi:hypothetical protein